MRTLVLAQKTSGIKMLYQAPTTDMPKLEVLCIQTRNRHTITIMSPVRKIVITLKHKICVRAIEMKSQYQMRTVNELLFTLRRICACKSYVGTMYMGVRSDYSLCIYRQKASVVQYLYLIG